MFKLTKKIINKELVPHLSTGKRGSGCKVGLGRVVRAKSERLKTGCQWRELPVGGVRQAVNVLAVSVPEDRPRTTFNK